MLKKKIVEVFRVLFFCFLFINKSYSQISEDSICRLVSKKLQAEKEIAHTDKIKGCTGSFYTREIYKDSVFSDKSWLLIVKFGVSSPHGKNYFCYIANKKVVFTKTLDLESNLKTVSSLMTKLKTPLDRQLFILDRIITEIKNDNINSGQRHIKE